MTWFEKIIGFATQKSSREIREANDYSDWSDYTTIKRGVTFARSHKITKFLIESWNYDAVHRNKHSEVSKNIKYLKA